MNTYSCTQEVLHDWVCVVAKGDLDWALKAVEVTVVASPLICLMLLHQREEFLGSPALGLEVIVVGGRGTGVHLYNLSVQILSRIFVNGLTMKLIEDPPPKT